MSGHSKWHNIAKRKGANDAKKAKIFTKIGREMAIAIKEGGSANPDFNARLRDCIAKAKANNMPNDNIKRTLDKYSGANGQVSITRDGDTTAGPQIQLANFVNPAGLEPLGNNLYRETVASGAPEAGNPRDNSLGEIRHKFLENSNINVVEELVSMIQTQRAYEMNSKAIQTSDQMLAKLSQL